VSEKCCKHPKDKLEHCSCCDGIHCKACGKKWPEKETTTIERWREYAPWTVPGPRYPLPTEPFWQSPSIWVTDTSADYTVM